MNLRENAEMRVDAKIKFKENLFKYLVTNLIIAVICLIFFKGFGILFLVMLFWGIGVLNDFFKAYSIDDFVGYNYRERKIQEELKRMGE